MSCKCYVNRICCLSHTTDFLLPVGGQMTEWECACRYTEFINIVNFMKHGTFGADSSQSSGGTWAYLIEIHVKCLPIDHENLSKMFFMTNLSHSPLRTISFWFDLFSENFGATQYRCTSDTFCLSGCRWILLCCFPPHLHHVITLLRSNQSDSFPRAFFPAAAPIAHRPAGWHAGGQHRLLPRAGVLYMQQ